MIAKSLINSVIGESFEITFRFSSWEIKVIDNECDGISGNQ